ncbi:CASP-like protein 4A3 [Bienertia sinuspersici]
MVGRYSMSVNIIGFAYSGLQGLDLLHQLTTKKEYGSEVRYSLDFAIDQIEAELRIGKAILAYLLLSASSSAFTRVDDWISNWGNDKFPAMASASVGVSFLAFIAFAMSSLISGYLLCTHRFT